MASSIVCYIEFHAVYLRLNKINDDPDPLKFISNSFRLFHKHIHNFMNP